MLRLNQNQRAEVRKKFAPVANDSVETASRMLAWCVYFFGDPENKQHFYLTTQDIPRVHWGIHLSLALNNQFYYCTAPREFAKSTHIRLNTLYRIYYGMERYILIIGKIGDSGKSMLSDQKYDIENNPKLLEVYGDLKPSNRDNVWSAHEIQLKNGVYMRSIGMMGNARGGLRRGWRYTFIIGDDVQDSLDMKEPSTLEKHRIFWEREIEFAIDSQYGKIRYIGNLIARGCLLETIMTDKRYKGISFHALVKEDGSPEQLDNPKAITGKSIWESKWPTALLRRQASDAIQKGKRAIFLAERQNILTDELAKTLAGYRYHHMQFQRIHDMQNVLFGPDYPEMIPIYTFLAIDPAFAKGKNSDERVLLTFARGRILIRAENTGNPMWFNCTWLLEYDYNHMTPTRIIDRALELHKKYYYRSVIVEAIGGAQIYEPMMNEKIAGDVFYSRYPFAPVFIKAQEADKKGRIYTNLQPKMSLGQIFIRPEMNEFENECRMFEALESPHLLDTLDFGEKNSIVCVEDLYIAQQHREDRRKPKREDARQIGWRPTNLAELGL